MIRLDIPGFGQLSLAHAVFDVNGTLATDGRAEPGIGRLLTALTQQVQVHLLSALTHGNREALEQDLGLPIHQVQPGSEAEQKVEYIQRLGASHCVAIGNGRNDILMLEAAGLAIAVLGAEGGAVQALIAADIVVRNAAEAVELLLNPKRIIATLRR